MHKSDIYELKFICPGVKSVSFFKLNNKLKKSTYLSDIFTNHNDYNLFIIICILLFPIEIMEEPLPYNTYF